MNKNLKEVIEKSVKLTEEELNDMRFSHILIINSDKRYNGFWGKNDYNNIILLGYAGGLEQYYFINPTYQVDSFKILNLLNRHYGFDIPRIYGCLRIFSSDGYFRIRSLLSSIDIELLKEDRK